MREIKLTQAAQRQLSARCVSFYEKDIETSIKSFTPGEWVTVLTQEKAYIGFVNAHVLAGPALRVVKTKQNEETPQEIIEKCINVALKERNKFISYENYRLFYGESDGLSGLIIDVFNNYVLIQINSAGIDTYREFIKEKITQIYPEKEVILFDNESYRKNEVLPNYESPCLNDVEICESGFKYSIDGETIQKIGYYFDHRENRLKLERFLKNIPQLEKGLDLFTYVGSWGLHMLRGGVLNVDFVDQANMKNNILKNLELNDLSSRGSFTRKDVFNFLDEKLQSNEIFDIIVSDPPAFSKSEKNIKKALGGYEKLHFKAMRLLKDQGYFVAASCTHGVSLEALDLTVSKAARRLDKNIKLLDVGIQGWDHPFEGLSSKAFYIKYLLYQVNK